MFMLLFSLGLTFYALTQPVRYQAEGIFREKGKSNSSFDPRQAMVLIAGNQKESEGEPIFKSRRVVSEAVKKLGLQAHISPGPADPGMLQCFFMNLWTEIAYFRNWDEPLFADKVYPFKISNLEYEADQRRSFSLVVKNGTFQLQDKKSGEKFSGSGTIVGDNFSFDIEGNGEGLYTLTFLPLTKTIKDVTGVLKVQSDKNDKTLIKLTYASRDRLQAKEVLNALMGSYLSYLEEDLKGVHDKQIGYLEDRQKKSFVSLKNKMELHAEEVAKDALNHGFIGSEKAIQFFAAHQEQLQAKKEKNDFQIKALRNIPVDRVLGVVEMPALAQKAQQLGEMRNFRDSLSLALWDPKAEFDSDQLASRVKEWESLQDQGQAIDQLIVALEERGMVESSDLFEGKIKVFINFWQDQLTKSREAFQHSSKENFYPLFNDFSRKKESFKNSLYNLKGFIDVQSSSLEEELVHSKAIDEEFRGIDLSLSQDLFKRYLSSLEELQAQDRHLAFLQDQIAQEDFALSSLSTIIQDPLAQDLVNKAATLEIAIRDPKNRSEKEQLRMKDELDLERNFLKMHIEQTLSLNHIKQNLLKEKFTALQRATLGFLHRQISFQEHQIKELIQSKLDALEQENQLYQEQIQNLGDQLASYPEKWVRDEMLKAEMQLQQMQAQEITRIVENKNITSNLELVQSSPLDHSYPPLLPIYPLTPVFALLGAFLGFLVGVCVVLAKIFTHGIPATCRNLKLQGQKVLGVLSGKSTLLDSDLETFRSIFVEMGNARSLLIVGKPFDFVSYVRKTEKRVLFIDLNFNTPFSDTGIFNFLINGIEPKIENDVISFGGTTRSYLELLAKPQFAKWLNTLEYDLIVASIPISPSSPAVDYLSTLFDRCLLRVEEETLEELESHFGKHPFIV